LCHAGVGNFVDHVVHLAAEGVESGDRGAPFGREKQKGVIKAAARGGGFLLYVVLRAHECGGVARV
jgi:hypothetical protein